MNILLVYATYSSGTLQASEVVLEALQTTGHTVIRKKAVDTTPSELGSYDLVIIGSPSWYINNKDGMPHEDFVALIERSAGQVFENKSFAIFGLGDTSYAHFCGAVDHLEEFIKNAKGNLVSQSIRFDGYLFDEERSAAKLRAWTEGVLSQIK